MSEKKSSEKFFLFFHEYKWFLAVLFLSLIFFSHFPLNYWNSDRVFGDEVFYYFQAQGINQGEFKWFSVTQPLLLPVVLSLLHSNIILMRLTMSLFIALSCALLFRIARKLFSVKTAFFSVLLFASLPLTTMYASLLYTESIFVFLLLSLLYLFLFFKKDSLYYVLSGVLLGLLMQARMIAVFFIPILIFLVFFKGWDRKHFYSMFISLLIFLPYFFLGGFKFFSEKSSLFSASLAPFEIYFGLKYIGLIFFALAIYSFLVPNKKLRWAKTIILFYFISLLLISKGFLFRYFFPAFPFISLMIASLIENKKKLVSYSLIALFFMSAFYGIYLSGDTKMQFTNFLFLNPPADCIEINSFQNTCVGQEVNLPFFGQDSNTICSYSSSFDSESESNLIFISYLDDKAVLYLDNELVGKASDPFRRHIFYKTISSGKHSLLITLENFYNIGGIGQVLICKNVPF